MFAPEKWNMYYATLENQPRTNNVCDGLNNKFFNLVGHAKPTVWKLIECLQAESSRVDTVLLQEEHGILPTKRRKRNYDELQTRLYNLVVDRKEGRKTIPELLKGISLNLRGGEPNV